MGSIDRHCTLPKHVHPGLGTLWITPEHVGRILGNCGIISWAAFPRNYFSLTAQSDQDRGFQGKDGKVVDQTLTRDQWGPFSWEKPLLMTLWCLLMKRMISMVALGSWSLLDLMRILIRTRSVTNSWRIRLSGGSSIGACYGTASRDGLEFVLECKPTMILKGPRLACTSALELGDREARVL